MILIAGIIGFVLGILFMIFISPDLDTCWKLIDNPFGVSGCYDSVNSIVGDIQDGL